MIRLIFAIASCAIVHLLFAQDDSISPTDTKKLFINGYVKDLRTISFANGFDNIIVDNVIHHRLNSQLRISNSLNFNLEFRNRIFYGEAVRNTPFYSDLIDVNNDYFDLSIIPVNKKSLLLHMMIDRAYLTMTQNKWEIRAGRQRINWGINTVWNPNDLFNAYSFFDFDYEERPGSDAVRITYYKDIAAGFELAAKAANDIDSTVAAVLLKTNKWNYDFQFLGGVSNGDAVIGSGWAGNIKSAGFKGELSYFRNYNNFEETNGTLISSITADYSFKNSLYSTIAFLFNSDGGENAGINELADYNISAKSLSPFRFTFFVQSAYPVTPIINASLAIMYAPDYNTLFINPSINYSIAENWDLNILSQSFLADSEGKYKTVAESLFIRLKWSY